MPTYRSKYGLLPGTSYAEIMAVARKEHHSVQKRTPRRQAYVRSQYFSNDKVFINSFWKHIDQKTFRDRKRRLKLFKCALDLIRNCNHTPDIKQNPNKPDEALLRFAGMSKDGIEFFVQIKDNKRNGRKDFISAFPARNLRNKKGLPQV